ncbi:MAG: cysteine desulfurase [Elusimicrobiota bacterium]
MGLDADKIRRDFPILARTVRGKPLVYLDNAATTQKPSSVISALKNFYERHNANIHRGVHALAEEAELKVEESRQKVADFINSPKKDLVVFTRNTTESVNLAAHGWGRKNIKAGDEILLTELEHHSNLVPWQMLCREKGAKLRFVPIEEDGTITVEAARRAITPKTKLFAFTALSNALGTILPVKELVSVAHENGALAFVDGAQWAPHMPTDVRDLDCDFFAFSAHKMLGPTGIGVLYGKENILEEMDPFMGGGDMIREVWYDRATYNSLPYKFEAGTPNIADAAAFGAAIDYLNDVGLAAIREHEERLVRRALEIVEETPGVKYYGPTDPAKRSGLVSFNVADLHPHDVGQVFDMEGIAVRVGHHCAQPLMRKLGLGGTARASFYLYNTDEELEAFGRGLRKVCEFFKITAEAGA